jgi:hypothetical protein
MHTEFTACTHVSGICSYRRELLALAHVKIGSTVTMRRNEFTYLGFHLRWWWRGFLAASTVGRTLLTFIRLSIGIEESSILLNNISFILLSFCLQVARHPRFIRLSFDLFTAIAWVSCIEIVISTATASPAIFRELFPSLLLLLGLYRSRSGRLNVLRDTGWTDVTLYGRCFSLQLLFLSARESRYVCFKIQLAKAFWRHSFLNSIFLSLVVFSFFPNRKEIIDLEFRLVDFHRLFDSRV